MSPSNFVVDAIHLLIETCEDGEYGFRSCAGLADRVDLQVLFTQRAQDCRRSADELRALGGESPQDAPAQSGGSHRGWVAVKGLLSGYSDLALLAECERGEEMTMQRYRSALEQDLPIVLRMVALRHRECAQRNRVHLRRLRDRVRMAHSSHARKAEAGAAARAFADHSMPVPSRPAFMETRRT